MNSIEPSSTLMMLQDYWWIIISVLGGILVFLLFVQGGQSMLLNNRGAETTNILIKAMGRKWELTFTTLVTFGGAMFASFPLFYSTSFGGAFWLWILILFSFIIQAVSYEYRDKAGNLFGTRVYDIFLFINGCFGCILLGVAVAMFFFGGEFTVERLNLVSASTPVISTWAPTHGFEAIFCWKNLVLGVAVLFLARTLAGLYIMNVSSISDDLFNYFKSRLIINAGIFLVFFLAFVAILLTTTGYTVTSATPLGTSVEVTPYKYFHNLISNPATLVCFLVGVVLVLIGIIRTILAKHYTGGIWWTGFGTFLTVMALFWLAGFNNTPFLPSTLDPASSLSIRNASSSEFTLKCMSYVSILIPFVAGYICYVWRSIDKNKVTANSDSSDDRH
ncbi:MAG: cytochrome d ubiquinol oxidase subunit II [Muribaculaceae bacterium]|nr:cytochrome d ubiquinol oxidase subunit II [Muribaculaceae bacterium]